MCAYLVCFYYGTGLSLLRDLVIFPKLERISRHPIPVSIPLRCACLLLALSTQCARARGALEACGVLPKVSLGNVGASPFPMIALVTGKKVEVQVPGVPLQGYSSMLLRFCLLQYSGLKIYK